MAPRRQNNLRFLSKVYQNLPDSLKYKQPLSAESSLLSDVKVVNTVPESTIADRLELRLGAIESLLKQILTQKRIKIVQRDQDDLIVKVIDLPAEQSD